MPAAPRRLGAHALSLIVAIEVSRRYRLGAADVHAVRNVSMSVEQGQFVLIRGRSGSGKTTLLNLLGGLDVPTTGAVQVDGQNISTFSERERNQWRRGDVAFVFQALALLPGLTALENIDLPLRIAGAQPGAATTRALQHLERVGLASRAAHRIFELSGGEQQRVAVARALVKEPTLVFADEPTGELDQASGGLVFRLLRSAVDVRQMTAVVTSHDPASVEYADVVFSMEDGRLTREGAG